MHRPLGRWAAVKEAQLWRRIFCFREHLELAVVREPSSGEALGLKQVAYQRKGGAECSDYQGQQQLRSPPRYAEHTVDILCGELGMEEAEVAALLASGSVVQGEY